MKIGIIGLGSVGGAVASAINASGIVREIILIDRDPLRTKGAELDLGHASVFFHDTYVHGGDYKDLKDADIVIIAAGKNQLPGQTRTDLLKANTEVIADIVPKIMRYADKKKVVIIVVTNPLDVMTMVAQKISGLPAERVIGTGTMLDSARFRTVLSHRLDVATIDLNAFVLGEHGDSSVVNWSGATVSNLPIDDFCKQMKKPISTKEKKEINVMVRNAAYEIIRGRGATWDGISASVARLVRAIANDERSIMSVSITAEGYLKNPVAFSVPSIIGKQGVIVRLMPLMNAAESAALKKSAETIRSNYDKV
jgi:L-lactate dehydrogenase